MDSPPPVLVTYRCRYCLWFLAESDAPSGRMVIQCRNRRCKHTQTVLFGRPTCTPVPNGPILRDVTA